MTFAIRPAAPGDAPLVLALIRELADYERLLHSVEATQADIEAALFGPSPRVFCDIAEWEGDAAGFAVWFYDFSTFYQCVLIHRIIPWSGSPTASSSCSARACEVSS